MKGGIDLSITTLAIIIAVIAIVLLLVAAFQGGLDSLFNLFRGNVQCPVVCGTSQSRCTDASSGQAPPSWGATTAEKACVQEGYPCLCP